MEKRFLRFPTVKRTALSAETYVSHMKNVRFRCRKRRTSRRNRRKPYIGFLVSMQNILLSCCQGVSETGKA